MVPHFAQANNEAQTKELMAALILNAENIRYGVSIHGSDATYNKKDLSGILAQNSVNEMAQEDGKVYVTRTTSQCRDNSQGRIGAQVQICSVTFTHEEHIVTDAGLMKMKNPSLSSVIMSFETSKAVVPNSKLQIDDNKVIVTLLARAGGNE